MSTWLVEYEIASRYVVRIEADSPAAASEIFEAEYADTGAGADFIEVDSRITHIAKAGE
jgi:hypothetical protein